MKELFPEVTLGLGGLEERVRASIGKPRLRQVGIVRRNHQLLDAPDLLSMNWRNWVGLSP